MKRILAISLVFVICLFIVACGGNNDNSPIDYSGLTANPKDNELLPFGLEFGMTEESAKQLYAEFPEMTYNDYETFYQIDGTTLYEDMMNGIGMVIDPNCNFEFNGNGELFELSVRTSIYENESPAEYLYNTYLAFFESKTGLSAKTSETTNGLLSEIDTDTLSLRVELKENDGDFTVSAVTTCKVYQPN